MGGGSWGVSLRSAIRRVCSTVMAAILLAPAQQHARAAKILRRQHVRQEHDARIEARAVHAPANDGEPRRDEGARPTPSRAPHACGAAALDLAVAAQMDRAPAMPTALQRHSV